MKSKYGFLIICMFILLLSSLAMAKGEANRIELKELIQNQGTISFVLNIDKTFQNGLESELYTQDLMKLPGVGSCVLQIDQSGIFIAFQWDSTTTHLGFYLFLRELPGPEKYHILFTWDAENGLSDGYFNGIPFRLENPDYYQPWEVTGSASEIQIEPGNFKISDLVVNGQYIETNEVKGMVPEDLCGQHSTLLGMDNLPESINIEKRKGRLLYESKLNNKESLKDWILEGPAIIDFADSAMIMRSEIPNPPDGSTGHFNYWCPIEFSDKIIVEWDFKPLTDRGVCHLFFAARGKNGLDIFDSSLPERDGHFQAYINGEIDNYYIIYFSNFRIMRTSNMARTWLCKSSPQTLLSLGQLSVIPGEKRFHKMQMIKDGNHIQLLADGKVYLDFTDPGNDRWGTVLTGGKISFRQMAVTMAMYRNFRVWELN